MSTRNEEKRWDVECHESSKQFVTFRERATNILPACISTSNSIASTKRRSKILENRGCKIEIRRFEDKIVTRIPAIVTIIHNYWSVLTARRTRFRKIRWQFSTSKLHVLLLVQFLQRSRADVHENGGKSRRKQDTTRDYYMLGQILQETRLANSTTLINTDARVRSARFWTIFQRKRGRGSWSTSLRNFLRRYIE